MGLELFLLLLVKHVIADLGLQSQFCPNLDKSYYFGNGHKHYLHHAACTFIATVLFLPLEVVIVITLIDYIAHWNIDFGKHQLNKFLGIVPRTNPWWWTNALDQALHFATYYAMTVYSMLSIA